MTEARFTTIADGLRAQVIERAILPASLPVLLAQLEAVRETPRPYPAGARAACTAGEHALLPWRAGIWQRRELQLNLCGYCGVVEVRDVSLDLLPGLATGRQAPRRRSDVLGWYAGSRPKGRTYM